jgi:hypothetical protein
VPLKLLLPIAPLARRHHWDASMASIELAVAEEFAVAEKCFAQ